MVMIKVKNIILGTWFNLFNRNKEISCARLDICNKCSDKTHIKKIGHICNHCGCILKSKTTVIKEHCPMDKW